MSYTIQSGDTFWSISQKLDMSVDFLQLANPGVSPATLQIGQIINVPGGNAPASAGSGYAQYGGPASAFPDPRQWASYDTLWQQNSRLMKFHDSDVEIGMIKSAIEAVAAESGIDVRVILCIIVQESGGNVRVQSVSSPSRPSSLSRGPQRILTGDRPPTASTTPA